MGKLIYSAITSLDGYVADADGKFDWGVPDEEVHAFVNELERSRRGLTHAGRPAARHAAGRRERRARLRATMWVGRHSVCAVAPSLPRFGTGPT